MLSQDPTLLLTKLTRPPVTSDRIERARLLEMLDRGLSGPLSLVSAAAGFGKTTLVSAWIEHLNPSDRTPTSAAWLSLDEGDSDLVVFLRYCVAAIHAAFPAACIDTLALLQTSQPVGPASLLVAFSNELRQLPARCVLVLDDYHSIRGQAVHDFLIELLRHWPQPLHLVLITRTSPPLPLANLRATGQIVEVRTRDLRFTQEESAAFLARVLVSPLSPPTINLLHLHVEGWVAGLRMATLSLRAASDAKIELQGLAASNAEIADYLVDQVISHQPPEVLRFLLATSILDRFCAPLCAHLLDVTVRSDDAPCDVAACIEWLERASLFVTPLDDDGLWYRYHHLFQDLLQRRLLAAVGAEQVAMLHRAAAAWLAEQGLIDEALRHALTIGDLDLAARWMQAGLCDVLNREDRATLERWLRLLPEDFIERDPWLLMIKALALQFAYQLPAVWKLLGQVDALINAGGAAAPQARPIDDLATLRGLVAGLRSQEAVTCGQAASTLDHCAEALALLPAQWRYARGGMLMFWGVGMRATGQGQAVNRKLLDEYAAGFGRKDAYNLRRLLTVCLNAFELGDLEQVRQVAQVLLEQAQLEQLAVLVGWAHFFLGATHYQWNELDNAAHHFKQVADRRYTVHTQAAHNSMIGLIWVHLARVKSDEAWQNFELLSQLNVERTGQERDDTRSLRAQMAYLRGEPEKALRWADGYATPAPDRLLNWLQDPHLARARLLLARGADDDLQTALDITASLLELAGRNFSTRFQIDILSLRAVAFAAQGNIAAALAALRQAVQLASPGGFLRVFVDLGPPMQTLLLQLAAQGYAAETVRRILAAFPAARSEGKLSQTMFATRAANAGLADPLTSRELEVLALLPERLSIKEIAYRLGLAPTTVKRHTTNLYSKLGVNKRWDAVLKAETLGILPIR